MRFFLLEYAKKFASIVHLYPKERLWFQNKCVPLHAKSSFFIPSIEEEDIC